MKLITVTQSAFSGFCATALLLSGCESNTVNGYFAAMPSSSSTTTSQGTSTTPVAQAPTSSPVSIPSVVPTLVPTTTPIPTPTATGTPVSPAPTATASPSPSPTPVALPSTFVPNGILNGHFDVDTAMTSMPFPTGKGTVTYHVHEYDKINKTTTVDFFNLVDGGGTAVDGNDFNQVQKSIPETKRFYLVVVNAGLNPGGVLELNGSVLRVTDYKNITEQLLGSGVPPSAYTIGAPQVAGDIQLTSLKIAFDSTVTANELLVPTAPLDCVFPDIPGKLGEYRDGALVVQAIDASAVQLNSSTGAATSSGGLIWEGVIYNHYMLTDSQGNEVDPEICY